MENGTKHFLKTFKKRKMKQEAFEKIYKAENGTKTR